MSLGKAKIEKEDGSFICVEVGSKLNVEHLKQVFGYGNDEAIVFVGETSVIPERNGFIIISEPYAKVQTMDHFLADDVVVPPSDRYRDRQVQPALQRRHSDGSRALDIPIQNDRRRSYPYAVPVNPYAPSVRNSPSLISRPPRNLPNRGNPVPSRPARPWTKSVCLRLMPGYWTTKPDGTARMMLNPDGKQEVVNITASNYTVGDILNELYMDGRTDVGSQLSYNDGYALPLHFDVVEQLRRPGKRPTFFLSPIKPQHGMANEETFEQGDPFFDNYLNVDDVNQQEDDQQAAEDQLQNQQAQLERRDVQMQTDDLEMTEGEFQEELRTRMTCPLCLSNEKDQRCMYCLNAFCASCIEKVRAEHRHRMNIEEDHDDEPDSSRCPLCQTSPMIMERLVLCRL